MPAQIVVRGLRKQFPKVLAVAGVDLDVAAGEVFGLLGPNGAGKTTTLEMIEGLTPAGRRRDRDLRPQLAAATRQEIRARIGVQLQATSLYNKITPREALDLFGSYYPKRRGTDELLELVQLKDKADAYHVTLSGGQAQRLALALALVNDPEVVFLDEPTAGLDPQGRRSLWEVVRTMKAEGRTTMLTTHYMDEAEALCDRLAILDHGKILRSGTPAELIASLGIPSVVELTFDGAAPDPVGVRGAARRRPIEARGDVWEIPTPDPKTLLPRLLTAIESERLDYSQVHVRRATLEDVFLQLDRAGACATERTRRELSLPNPLRLLGQQFRIEWRLYARDRGAMFWTFLFPLLMLFGFGVIFRSGGRPALTLVRVAPAAGIAARPRVRQGARGVAPEGRDALRRRGGGAVGEGRDDRAARERRRRLPPAAEQLPHRPGPGRGAGREPGVPRRAGAARTARPSPSASRSSSRAPGTRTPTTTRRSSCRA